MIRSALPAGPIGLIADVHVHAGRIALPEAALEALRGAALILALGDLGEPSALDRLAEVAPVLATRGGDDAPADPRYADARLLTGGDTALAAAFELGALVPGAKSEGHAFPDARVDTLLRERAGCAVQVVAFAATHMPAILARDGVLFVNPGS